ncbi:hypothetical protein M3J09_002223 [Ascochyta lentis]
MDPLSITAGSINVARYASTILDLLRGRDKEIETSKLLSTIQLEFQIYTRILEEVGQIALSGSSTIPENATLSLKLCHQQLSDLEAYVRKTFFSDSASTRMRLGSKKLGAGVVDELVSGMKDYRRSVKVLRDIVTDAMTQELLIKNANSQLSQPSTGDINIVIDWTRGEEMIESQVEALMKRLSAVFSGGSISTGSVNIANSFMGKAQDADTHQHPADILEKLKRAAEGINTSAKASQSSPNPFEFYAKIMRAQGSSEEETRVCVKLDTGSKDNWISGPTVDRAGMRDLIEPTAEKLYTGADGSMFYSAGTVPVRWTRNSTKSWETSFLVLERATFDMLLGQQFIIEEGLFVFADPVLATDLTRLGPLSKEDLHQMEQNMRKKGVENQELKKTREAIAAAARERRRAQKSASRATTTPGSVTPTTLSSFRPTPSPLSQAGSTHDQDQQRSYSQASNETGDLR